MFGAVRCLKRRVDGSQIEMNPVAPVEPEARLLGCRDHADNTTWGGGAVSVRDVVVDRPELFKAIEGDPILVEGERVESVTLTRCIEASERRRNLELVVARRSAV